MADRQPALTMDELADFVGEVFPERAGFFRILSTGPMTATVLRPVRPEDLRPGGTVSGPTMFEAADCAFYYAVLAMIGREALTVTTSLTINFLTKPPVADLRAEARILKLGRLLATGDVTVYSVGMEQPVAHCVVTYAIPPKRG